MGLLDVEIMFKSSSDTEWGLLVDWDDGSYLLVIKSGCNGNSLVGGSDYWVSLTLESLGGWLSVDGVFDVVRVDSGLGVDLGSVNSDSTVARCWWSDGEVSDGSSLVPDDSTLSVVRDELELVGADLGSLWHVYRSEVDNLPVLSISILETVLVVSTIAELVEI